MYYLAVWGVRSLKWVSLSDNQCVHKAALLGNDPFSCLLQLLVAPTSLACGLLPFKVNNGQLSVSHPASLWQWLSRSFLHLWGSLWSHQAQPDNPASLPIQWQLINNFNSVCSLNSLLLYKVTYLQAIGIKTWISLGGHYSAYHKFQVHLTILSHLVPFPCEWQSWGSSSYLQLQWFWYNWAYYFVLKSLTYMYIFFRRVFQNYILTKNGSCK